MAVMATATVAQDIIVLAALYFRIILQYLCTEEGLLRRLLLHVHVVQSPRWLEVKEEMFTLDLYEEHFAEHC